MQSYPPQPDPNQPRPSQPFPPPTEPMQPPTGSMPSYTRPLSQPIYYPPPSPPPVSPLRGKEWIVSFYVVLCLLPLVAVGSYLVGYNSGSAQSSVNVPTQNSANVQPQNTPTEATPTPTLPSIPTQPLTWTTIQTFKGTNNKKTAIFTVPDDWKMLWKCTPDEFGGGNFAVQIYSSDNSYIDLAVNTICQSGATSDETEEHQGGQVYLNVMADAPWTIQIQVLQ